MKIVHALGWYFPESLGGSEVYVSALARRLRDAGHHVWVAAPDPARASAGTYEHDGIEIFRYPIPSRPTRDEAQGRTPVRGAEHFHRWLAELRPEVLHCHSLVTGLGLHEIDAARAAGARVVVTCHTPSLGFLCQRGSMLRFGRELCDGIVAADKCAACDLQSRGMPAPMARLAGSLPLALSRNARRLPGRLGTALGMPELIEHNRVRQRTLVDRVEAFVVLTEWARAAVAANHGSSEKLVLNRLGIEPNGGERNGHARPAGIVRLGFVGRFDEAKGIFVLAEAVSRLPRELSFSLELRGPATGKAGRETLAALREKLASDERVRFGEAVEHGRVGDVLSGYDALLCPSLCLEGGPTIALEAQSVGTPVLGSRIGGLAEIVEDGVNGCLVTPGDAGELARAIERIVREPSLLERWRRAAPAPRTMDEVTADYVTLYAALAGD